MYTQGSVMKFILLENYAIIQISYHEIAEIIVLVPSFECGCLLYSHTNCHLDLGTIQTE